MKKQEVQVNAATEPTIRILKIGTCPSVSGKSKLSYHVAIRDESELLFRVFANSSSGYFSQEYISLNAIQEIFTRTAHGTITSYLLNPLFINRSVNTPAFMTAVLLAEGLVQASSSVDRHYEATDGKAFFEGIQKLIESGISIDPNAKPSKKKAASEPALPA